jgi:hypothetical protein
MRGPVSEAEGAGPLFFVYMVYTENIGLIK